MINGCCILLLILNLVFMNSKFIKFLVFVLLNGVLSYFVYFYVGFAFLMGFGLEGFAMFGLPLTIFSANISVTILGVCFLEGLLFLYLYRKLSKFDSNFIISLIVVFVVQFVAIVSPQWFVQTKAVLGNPVQDGEVMLDFVEGEAVINDRISMKTNLTVLDGNVFWKEHVNKKPKNVWRVFRAELGEDFGSVKVSDIDLPGEFMSFDGDLCSYSGYCYDLETNEFNQLDAIEKVSDFAIENGLSGIRYYSFLSLPDDKVLLRYSATENVREGAVTTHVSSPRVSVYDHLSGEITDLDFNSGNVYFASSNSEDEVCYASHFHAEGSVEFGKLNFSNLEIESFYEIEGTGNHKTDRGSCQIYTCDDDEVVYSCSKLGADGDMGFYEYDFDTGVEENVKSFHNRDVKLLGDYLYFVTGPNVISRMKIGDYEIEEFVTVEKTLSFWDIGDGFVVYLEKMPLEVDRYASVLWLKRFDDQLKEESSRRRR